MLPRIYGFSTLGQICAICRSSRFPSCSPPASSARPPGLVFRHRETAVLLVRRDHLPQFFLVGAVLAGRGDPAGHAPDRARSSPPKSAIDGLVRINQMGASLGEVSKDWMSLLALGLAYYLLAVLGSGLRRRRLAYAG